MEHTKARQMMVERQLAGRDIKDSMVLEAMRSVPRHLFVPEAFWDRAYDDMAMAIGQGQTISQPYMVAKMTEMLELTGSERVLEVGTGSGYQSAVLAALSKEVFSIERIEELAGQARVALESAGVEGVTISVRDGTGGWPEKAPFDRILVTAAAPDMPEPLIEQLAEGGILLAPVGPQTSQQLIKVVMHEGKTSREHGIFCVFVPLIGKYGFEDQA